MPRIDPAVIVLATLVGSLILFLTERVRYEVVAILVVLVLALTGCLSAQEAFAGFASPATVLIASMYVFGQAFNRSGVARALGERFLGSRGGGETGFILRVTLLAGLLSSVLSNTGVVATLIPVCATASRQRQVPVTRVLMPMAFGSLVGGLVTVLATSTNIAVNAVIRDHGGVPFELFEFTPLGLVAVAIAALYFLGPGRLLLPRGNAEQSLAERYQVPKFVTEVLVEPSSTLINRAVADTDLFSRYAVTILGIVRAGGEGTVLAPGPYNRIRAEDTLILQGAPEDIVRLSQDFPLRQRSSVDAGDTRLYSDDVRLVEAVVPAGSRFAGQTLRDADFRARSGLNVLALAKHGHLQLQRVQHTPLEIGDTLLLQGHVRDIERARRERQLIVLDEFSQPSFGRGAKTSIGVLAGVVLLGALTPFDLGLLALLGATCLVLFGPVRPEEAPRVVDWSVIALVGGMLALGTAFDRHGLGDAVASWLRGLGSSGLGPMPLLSVLLLVSVALTQVINNVATAVIMTPVALSIAESLGLDAKAFLMAVLAGANLAFLSPVAHQVNAMVTGAGAYRYKDFLRVGGPLTVLLVIVCLVVIPLLWPFVPAL